MSMAPAHGLPRAAGWWLVAALLSTASSQPAGVGRIVASAAQVNRHPAVVAGRLDWAGATFRRWQQLPSPTGDQVVLLAGEPLECQDNLLRNPGFEHGFAVQRRLDEVVASGWRAWYLPTPTVAGGSLAPSFGPRFRGRDPVTAVHGGLWSQEWWTRQAVHVAGLYQRIRLPSGSRLAASVWGYAWATNGDDPARSEPPNTYALLIGVDPLAGEDPTSARIVWSVPMTVTDQWLLLTVEVPVHGSEATVFLRGQALLPLRHDLSRWDDACARVVGPIDEASPSGLDGDAERLTVAASPVPSPTLASEVLPATREALAVSLRATVAASSAAEAGLAERRSELAEPSVPFDLQAAAEVGGDRFTNGSGLARWWRRVTGLSGMICLGAAALLAGLALAVPRREAAHSNDVRDSGGRR